MCYKEKVKIVKKFFLAILKNRAESEDLQELIEKVETLEGINEIIKNNNLTPLEKDIEFVKIIAKENIKKNRSIGMMSKMALISIINKNQPIKNIFFGLVNYMAMNNMNK